MTLNPENIDQLRAEIACFARAGTSINIEEKGHSELIVQWQYMKNSRESRFRWREGTQSWLVHDTKVSDDWLEYRDFLASDHMADLRFLAQQIVLNVKIPDNFLPATITCRDEEGLELEPKEAVRALTEQVDTANADRTAITRTQVLFLRGEAGTGKSVALRNFAIERSRQYLGGKSKSLCLYVDAQGKALLNIHDAFSSMLDDLSINAIRKDTVAVLCRHGLLVPLIDGFDELLGSGGYGEAFNSLGTFIATLQRHGVLITSGRSAFYDDQYLQVGISQLSSSNLDYHTVVATIDPWTETQIRDYCRSAWAENENRDRLLSNLERLISKNVVLSLLRKPFFTAQVADLIPAQGFDTERFLVEQLVDGLLQREKEKLKTTEGTPVLSTAEHYKFLEDVAEEMWWQRTLELDTDTVRLLAESSTSQLSVANKTLIINRSTTHAAFESERRNQVFLRFQHAVYFDFFLQRKLLGFLEQSENGSLLSFLERGILTESTLALLAEACRELDLARIKAAVRNCCAAMRPDARYQAARQNAAAVVASLLSERHADVSGIELRWLLFRKVSLCDFTLVDSKVYECEFENVKMYGFQTRNVDFHACRLDLVVFNHLTHIDTSIEKIGFIGTIIFSDQTAPNRRILVPSEKVAILSRVGIKVAAAYVPRQPTAEQRELIDLLDRFLRRMERYYYVSPELEQRWGYNAVPAWKGLKALLAKHKLLVSRSLQKHGPVGALDILARTPSQIRQGLAYMSDCPDERIAGFWDELLDSK